MAKLKRPLRALEELFRHILAAGGHEPHGPIQDFVGRAPFDPSGGARSGQAAVLLRTKGNRGQALIPELSFEEIVPIVAAVVATVAPEEAGTHENFPGLIAHGVHPSGLAPSWGLDPGPRASLVQWVVDAKRGLRLSSCPLLWGSRLRLATVGVVPGSLPAPFFPRYRPMRPVQFLLLPLVLVALPTAQADTIHLIDGSTIEDVKVKEETLHGVLYKDGRAETTIESGRIASITFQPMPGLIDRAEAGLDEDQYMGSVMGLEEYIAQNAEPERKFPWALPYAYYRVIELQQVLGEWDAVIAAADRLLAKAGTSRYATFALVKKAEAQFDSGKSADALATLDTLSQLSKSASLGERWDIEADLRRILFDPSQRGQTRIRKLEAVSSRAGGQFPEAWGRAEVAIGEAYLKDNKQAEAEAVFRAVAKEVRSDRYARAAAWSGVGACLFNKAASAAEAGDDGAPALARESALAHMRVLVLYRDQTRFLSGALYWAGRSFDLIGDEESSDRAQRLYRKVIRNHKGSRWAEEARAFYKKR